MDTLGRVDPEQSLHLIGQSSPHLGGIDVVVPLLRHGAQAGLDGAGRKAGAVVGHDVGKDGIHVQVRRRSGGEIVLGHHPAIKQVGEVLGRNVVTQGSETGHLLLDISHDTAEVRDRIR